MTILNRPMFLQAGGEAGPEAAMLQEAEAGAMAQGEQLGAQYAQQMMQGIDQAQSTEDLINALRGNDKTLEARRGELANFVGQNDANQTPESVLAMVQPVIMMTEEGMMDSGIGALVQQIVGDVEMTTDGGAPTDMAMGVGSLMAAGAQGAPTPQNFRNGGEVAYMNRGGMPAGPAAMSMSPMEIVTGPTDLASETVMGFGDTVKGYYDEMLPLYKEILGQDDASRQFDKSQMLFDIAQGGLALAAGVPGAGSSFASQLAGAAAPVAASIQQRGADIRAREDRLKAGALETALGRAAKDAEYEQMMDLAEAKAGRTKPEFRMITDLGTGKKIFVDINTPQGAAAVQQAGAANAASPSGNAFSVNTVSSESMRDAKTFMLPEGYSRLSFDGGRTYLDLEGNPQPMPTEAIPLSDQIGYDIVATQARRNAATEKLRTALGGDGSNDAIVSATVKGGDRDTPTALTQDERSALTQLLVESPDPTNPVTAAQEGTGLAARFGAALDDIYGGATGTDIFQDLQANRQYLKGIRVLGRSALVVNPRFPVAEMENVAELFPDPDSWWVNPTTQANKLIEMKRLAQQVLLQNLEYISNSAPSEMIADIEANNRELERLLSILKRVPATYDTNERQTQVTTTLRNALKGKR